MCKPQSYPTLCYDILRQLIRIWVGKFEAGALDDDIQAADLMQEYEAKIAAIERLVGRQALEIKLLKPSLIPLDHPVVVVPLALERPGCFVHPDAGPVAGVAPLQPAQHARFDPPIVFGGPVAAEPKVHFSQPQLPL